MLSGKRPLRRNGAVLRSAVVQRLRWSAPPCAPPPWRRGRPCGSIFRPARAPLPGWPRPWRGRCAPAEGSRYGCSAPWPTTCGERSTSRSATWRGTGWTASSPCAAGRTAIWRAGWWSTIRRAAPPCLRPDCPITGPRRRARWASARPAAPSRTRSIWRWSA